MELNQCELCGDLFEYPEHRTICVKCEAIEESYNQMIYDLEQESIDQIIQRREV